MQGSEDKRKFHLVDWDIVTITYDKGGLGIPNLGDMNAACWLNGFLGMETKMRVRGDELYALRLGWILTPYQHLLTSLGLFWIEMLWWLLSPVIELEISLEMV